MTTPRLFYPLFCALLGASCHVIGGTDGLYIDPDIGIGGSGGNPLQSSTSSVEPATTSGGGSANGCQAENCPGDDQSCRWRACVNGECGFINAEPDATCNEDGGNYCDDGQCVECTSSDHCAPGTCQDNQCYGADCDDDVQNHAETDVDCGGLNCGGCDNGFNCLLPADCLSKLCIDSQCAACTEHEQCPSGNYCAFASNYCRLLKSNGAFCQKDWQCASGKCAIICI